MQSGLTPLHFMATQNSPVAIEFLVSLGANVNVVNQVDFVFETLDWCDIIFFDRKIYRRYFLL